MWERMLWRGCDFGMCSRRRGVGAEPLALSRLPELAPSKLTGPAGESQAVFGEVSGGALTFTWSATHSLLHHAWDANLSKCRAPPPRAACYPRACAAQVEWERSIGGGSERRFTVPWLMRAVHGTDKACAHLEHAPPSVVHSLIVWCPSRR